MKEYLNSFEFADQKQKIIIEEVKRFESSLDDEHEVAIKLISFGSSITMYVTGISYQNPDLLYFYGIVDGNDAQLIQHVNQLNFLIIAVERQDKTTPARRIGFLLDRFSDEL